MESHCDAGDILTTGVGKAEIGSRGFLGGKINECNKDKACVGGIPIGWYIKKSLPVATSFYAGVIRDAFRVYDKARFLKSSLAELLVGGENLAVRREYETIIPLL